MTEKRSINDTDNSPNKRVNVDTNTVISDDLLVTPASMDDDSASELYLRSVRYDL